MNELSEPLNMPGIVHTFGGDIPGVTIRLENGWRVRIDGMEKETVRDWARKYFRADVRVRMEVFAAPTNTKGEEK